MESKSKSQEWGEGTQLPLHEARLPGKVKRHHSLSKSGNPAGGRGGGGEHRGHPLTPDATASPSITVSAVEMKRKAFILQRTKLRP